MIKEVLPGIHHWSVWWPDDFSLESYLLRSEDGTVLIDPMDYGVDVSDVVAIVVTCVGHERSARVFASESGAPTYLPELDARWVEDSASFEVYANGDDLPGGLKAIEISGGEKKEFAVLSPLHGGTLFIGDALGTMGKWTPGEVSPGSRRPLGGPIGGHPRRHPHPSQSLAHLLDLEFQNLLPGHGPPYLGYAKQRLAELIERDAVALRESEAGQ
jgi:glyoxylase-like metal-dependent hydrolase (beta-lactamase superfamily II)